MRSRWIWALSAALAVTGCAGPSKQEGDDADSRETKEVEIRQDQLPAAVRAGFQRDYPNAKIDEAKKETYANGTIHYEIEFKDAAGKEQETEYTAEGERLDEH
ncbi:MAG TPA: hypothetical protein VER17_00150 [Tepidisphaeraceae bacterium]|nr:hypothetical protein [Tepidisphaeraceae bacterium]